MKSARDDVVRWPTMVRTRWRDGRVLGVDGSMWLYRSVPFGPVDDARSPEASQAPAEPLMSAFEEVSTLAGPIRVSRRATAKASYREIQILLVDIPRLFTSAEGGELGDYLRRSYGGREVPRRVLLFGVRLVPKMPAGSLMTKAAYVMDTWLAGGSPVEDYARDFADVSAALARCGLSTPGDEDFAVADAWWNRGANPWVQYLPHVDHLHVFTTTASAQAADTVKDSPCETWVVDPSSHTLSFAAASEIELGFTPSTSSVVRWASRLVDSGAVMVSVRGLVEPARVTREELRRMRKAYLDDINERYAQGRMERSEQEETMSALADVEAFYARGGSPTLTQASLVVAFSGRDERNGFDPTLTGQSCGLSLVSMLNIQPQAWMESMIASPVRANPVLQDLPSQAIAYSGLPSLSAVGDRTGAVLGFTERDGQPARVHHMAASDSDSLPIMVVAGATGSGKSMLMVHLAKQFALQRNSLGERVPVIIADPSPNSDLSAVVESAGGRTVSLDDLMSADGIFDPLRYARTPELGVELAVSMLLGINPWGSGAADVEVDLSYAIGYGVAQGATCTMEALRRAQADGKASADLLSPVERLIAHNPMARAVCGSTPGGDPLRVAQGITYIRLGNAPLNLPKPGQADTDIPARVAMAVVRSWAFGAVCALDGRDGVVFLDEGWVFTQNGASDMERIGRLARKMNVFPVLLSQRLTDAVKAGLSGYISRGLILPIADREEATAACQLFRLEPTERRLDRITAPATMGQSGSDHAVPNWSSMYALRDPVTRQVLRGTVGIYSDLSGRAAPVEVVIPPELLAGASTNRLDILERTRARAADPPEYPAPEPVGSDRIEVDERVW